MALAATTGCAGNRVDDQARSTASQPAPSPSGPAVPRGSEEWTADGPPTQSWVATTSDSALYLGQPYERTTLIAVDPSTGHTRWQRKATPPAFGRQTRLLTDGHTVYFYAPDDGGALTITAVDTATNTQRWQTPIHQRAGLTPQWCGGAICVDDEIRRTTKIDATDGHIIEVTDLPEPDDVLRLDPLRIAPTEDDGIRLIANGDTIVQYRNRGRTRGFETTISAAFPGVPVSPHAGWTAYHEDGVTILWLGDQSAASGPQGEGPIPAGATAAIADDGTALWMRPGWHPCRSFQYAYPVLCDGPLVFDDKNVISEQASMIDGVDPHTGASRWEVPLPSATAPGWTTRPPVRISDKRFLVDAASGMVDLDLVTGPRPAKDPGATGWCQPPYHSEVLAPYPCHADGVASPDPPKPFPDYAGANASSHSMWVQDATIRGH